MGETGGVRAGRTTQRQPLAGAGLRGRADRTPAGPLRVLVVDDAEPIRRLVARALASEGFVVDEAADGHQAATRPTSGSTPSPPTSWSSKRS